MIAVLISIRPKWCEKIISGEKTIEVRKTRPKMDTPFKCYIYCTKPEEKLLTIMKDGDENYGETYHGKPVLIKTEKAPTTGLWDKRQKVIGEFLCDQIININGAGRIPSDAARPTCLEPAELPPATAGTSQICAFTITRAICGSLPACGRQNTALRPGPSPARRRAGGMWRKNYGKIDKA